MSTVEQLTSAEAGNFAQLNRRLPIGAEFIAGQGVHFRVWAPKRKQVLVVFEDADMEPLVLKAEPRGYFSGLATEARPGTLYRFQLDNDKTLYPDPATRFQPKGVHGPSQVIDPSQFQWSDKSWPGVPTEGQVLYEMHIGTFTKEGSWDAAIEHLAELKDVGITCLEVMPVNEFAGKWNWGYDGVQWFATHAGYGSPDDMRRFIDRAHALGLGVILDVVYNHLGPDGNYTGAFSDDYQSKTHMTDWGEAMNWDGPNCHGLREFVLANIRLWIEEYHFDGFRFDATQAILDNSSKHILVEITETARAAGDGRLIYLVNENEPQDSKLVRPVNRGGFGMNANWNDDFHHSAHVALSGHNEAYYMDYQGTPQELISAAKWGFLFQGQRYKWQKRLRGAPAMDLPPTAFIHFLQNHDQIANSARGYRAHHFASVGDLKAMTALLLLMPQTPMLFQGQEFAASSPFLFFSNHNSELAVLVAKGRAKEIAQFPSAATEKMQQCLADPSCDDTFYRSKIDHEERNKPFHSQILQLHKDLLKLRREDPAFRRVQRRGDIDGAVLGPSAFVLRYFGHANAGGELAGEGDDRLLIVNLGSDIALDPAPEPLLAAPPKRSWQILLTTEDPAYGGSGTAPLETELEGWHIPGRTAVVLRPALDSEEPIKTRFRVQGSAQEAKRKENTTLPE